MATLEEVLKEIASGASGGYAVQGLLKSLGVGARGLDTPAEREYLMGVMDTGKTLPDADITKLGIGQRGLNTPAERDFLANTMGQGTALTDADITKLGIGARGLNTPAEREFLMNQLGQDNEFSHQVGEGYNQRFDSWSPTDGIPGQGNPHIGEPISNLGLPNGLQTPAERDSSQTASYKAGYTSGGYNPNWGTGKYNYMKGVFDAQTIDAMINANEIHPKTHTITPRPDIGEDAFHVKLASTDNSFYNQQLGAFFPYNKESGFTGGRTGDDRFNQNPYKNTGNPYSGLSYPWQTPIPLDFNNFS